MSAMVDVAVIGMRKEVNGRNPGSWYELKTDVLQDEVCIRRLPLGLI